MKRGFTLIELLVVIGIVAIISAVIVLALNPAQLLRQARDSNRLSDYNALNQAFNLLGIDTTQVFGVASTTYISIPDPTATSTAGTDCSGVVGLPSLPPNWIYHCAVSSTYRSVNGTGWMPVNFSLISSGAPFGTIPVDPVNTAQSGFFYAYVAGANRYVFTIPLDSEKYLSKEKLALRDRGTDPTRLESGTDLLLWARAMGLNGYWPFDEIGGTTANDSSGSENNGTLMNGPVWITGQVDGALSFDGNNDYVNIGQPASLVFTGAMTISVWVKLNALGDHYRFITKQGDPGNRSWSLNMENDNPDVFCFQIASDASTIVEACGSAADGPATGVWTYLTGVYYPNAKPRALRLYKNGTLIVENTTSIPTPQFVANGLDINIGRRPDNAFHTPGSIDEARVYNRALNAQEIQRLYYATR